MSQAATQTKCSREGCDQMTANTFCSRECNRLAFSGAGTRGPRKQSRCGVSRAADEVPLVPNCDDWEKLRDYFKDDEPKDSSIARRLANIRKRRMEREELARKRRELRRKKQR